MRCFSSKRRTSTGSSLLVVRSSKSSRKRPIRTRVSPPMRCRRRRVSGHHTARDPGFRETFCTIPVCRNSNHRTMVVGMEQGRVERISGRHGYRNPQCCVPSASVASGSGPFGVSNGQLPGPKRMYLRKTRYSISSSSGGSGSLRKSSRTEAQARAYCSVFLNSMRAQQLAHRAINLRQPVAELVECGLQFP